MEVIFLHNRVNIEAERGRLQMTKGEMCEALGVTLKTYNQRLHPRRFHPLDDP